MSRLKGLADPRVQARLVLCVGLFVLPLGAFAWIAAPGFMEPMFSNPGSHHFMPSIGFVPLIGFVGILIGELLMYRIYHADSDDGERSWRYRDY